MANMQTKSKLVLIGLLAAAWVAAGTAPAHATIWTLTDQASTVRIDDSTSWGAFDWVVDGTDHLYQEGFWFRVGSAGGEAHLSSLALSAAAQPLPNFLSLTYTGPGFEITTLYSLLGGSPGSNTSDLAQQIRIENTGDRALDMHFFQYADFDLGTTIGGDTAQFIPPHVMRQFDPFFILSETIVLPSASHYQVGFFPGILNSLNDGTPTTLSDFGGPITGDATWAFQWDRQIAPGQSFLISKDKQLRPIPEPASLLLLGAGLLGLALRRRH